MNYPSEYYMFENMEAASPEMLRGIADYVESVDDGRNFENEIGASPALIKMMCEQFAGEPDRLIWSLSHDDYYIQCDSIEELGQEHYKSKISDPDEVFQYGDLADLLQFVDWEAYVWETIKYGDLGPGTEFDRIDCEGKIHLFF